MALPLLCLAFSSAAVAGAGQLSGLIGPGNHQSSDTFGIGKSGPQLLRIADKYPSTSGGSPSGANIRVDQGRINATTGRASTSGSSRFSVDRGRVSPPGSAASTTSKKKVKKKHASKKQKCNWRLKNDKQKNDCLRKAPKKNLVKPQPNRTQDAKRIAKRSPVDVVVPPPPTPRSVFFNVEGKARTDQVLVTTGGNGSDVSQIAHDNSLRVLAQRFSELLQLTIVQFAIDDDRSVEDVVAQLSATGNISAAAPNHLFALQDSQVEQMRFAPQQVRLNQLANTLTGKGVRVAVIDTAVDNTHPALRGAIADTYNGLPNTAIAQTRHGTAIAGLIAGRSILRGAAPASELLIARAFDGPDPDKLSTDTYVLISCLDWAVKQRASIVNMSFAGPDNKLLGEAITAAANQNVIVIAAAGNNGPTAKPAYPGAYPATLAVTATDANNNIFKGANQGEYVFLSAPGVDILAPIPGGSVDVVSGTSFSAALVSGIAALHVERSPNAKLGDVIKRLSRSGRDLGSRGKDRVFGHGLIDAALLVTP